jgi:hypothetical protein
MKQKPLADSEKAAYRQLVKDKSLPLRIRYFSERLLKIFLYLGILTLTVYGIFFSFGFWFMRKKKLTVLSKKFRIKS